MASFAPTFIIQQGGSAIRALLRGQLTLISLLTEVTGSRRIKTSQDCRLLLRFGSIWLNLVSINSPQGCVQTGPIGAIRLIVASKLESGSHNDIIITSCTNHRMYGYSEQYRVLITYNTYVLKHFLPPPPNRH